MAGLAPPQGYTLVELAILDKAQTASYTKAGVFKKYTLLKNISIGNNGSSPATLSVGYSANGTDLVNAESIEVPSNNEAHNIDIHKFFWGPVTLYITLSAGANLDIAYDYLQYDASPVAPGTSGATSGFPINFIGMWEAINDTDFATHWDIATGLGKTGTPYAGCAICDGRNGTVDRGGSVAIGFAQKTDANWLGIMPGNVINGNYEGYDQLSTPDNQGTVGVPLIRQSLQQMAVHSHPITTRYGNTGTQDGADPVKAQLAGSAPNSRGGGQTQVFDANGNGTVSLGRGGDGVHDSQTIGLVGGNNDNTPFGAPMENRQLSIVTLFFKKIAA